MNNQEFFDNPSVIRARRLTLLFKIKQKRLTEFRKELDDLKDVLENDLKKLVKLGFLKKRKFRHLLTKRGWELIKMFLYRQEDNIQRIFYASCPERRKRNDRTKRTPLVH